MVCLGFEPGAARWKAQMNPLSYGGTPKWLLLDAVKRLHIRDLHARVRAYWFISVIASGTLG